MKARIVDVKRFAVHDGDGIRTTIFFKGCPLRCIWCHNPESLSAKAEIGYVKEKCLNCGTCSRLCSANRMIGGNHEYRRENCDLCGQCLTGCPMDCFRFYGRFVTVDELLEVVMEDKDFFEESGGGVTLSGGECLLQADFCRDFLKECHKNKIHTAVDTCGFVAQSELKKVIPYTDVFLYDIKAIDEDVHIRCTGQSNRIILENLKYLDSLNANVEVRYPYVPGYNTDQAEKIAEFLSKMKHLNGIRLLPYRNLSRSKYESLGLKNTMPEVSTPDKEMMLKIREVFRAYDIPICGD